MTTIKKMDLLAQTQYGEYGFATCHENDQVQIVDALIADKFSIDLQAMNPQSSDFLNALGREQVRLSKIERALNTFEITLEGKFDNLVKILKVCFDANTDEYLMEFIYPTKQS